MQIKRCRKNGNPGFKFGDTCYTYITKDAKSRKRAKKKAEAAEAAANASSKREERT